MPDRMAIVVDDSEAQKRLKDVGRKRGRAILLEFRAYHAQKTDEMFDFISSARGGRHRGERWAGFRPQYVRKDGTVIPAWGGVTKVRGGGQVKGRLRPSGRRVDASSNLMQDTGNLRGKASSATFSFNNKRIIYGPPASVRYARRQQALRAFLFFNHPKDQRVFNNIAFAHIHSRGPRRGGLMAFRRG